MTKAKSRPDRKQPRRSAVVKQLNRESIVAAALAEIDSNGVDDFNLRSLAKRLGVFPTAIYWHVPTKYDILAEVVGAVFRGVAPPRNRLDWRDYLRELFNRYRASIKRHPNIAPLVGAHLVGNLSIEFDFVEGVLGALEEAGLSGPHLVAAYNAVIASLIGFVVQEFSPVPDQGWQTAVQMRLSTVDSIRHPVLSANLGRLANKAFILRWQNGEDAPLNQSFELFIDQVVAGIEYLVSRSP
jgi:TetR/AcrR family transcriptional regulator, tetracycline repressor protein